MAGSADCGLGLTRGGVTFSNSLQTDYEQQAGSEPDGKLHK
jgi:hypothetical protein